MNPWFILGAAFAIAAAGAAGLYQGHEMGMAEVQQKWDKERAEQEAQYAAAQSAAREKEQSLQAAADKLRQEKDSEVRNLNARATALSNSLRDRANRTTTESSTVSSSTDARSNAASCDGTGLPREDAEFLVGEATRAEQLKAALRQCQAQYETLRSK
jgi:hypothetical protein